MAAALAIAAAAHAMPPTRYSCTLDRRIARVAAEYKADRPPRLVLRDLAFPANPAEYVALRKSAAGIVSDIAEAKLALDGLSVIAGVAACSR